jgi:hypothetical protein
MRNKAAELFTWSQTAPQCFCNPLFNWFEAADAETKIPAFLAEVMPLLAELETKLVNNCNFPTPTRGCV